MPLTIALLLAGVEVSGTSTCPSVADVQAKLRPLLPAAEAPSSPPSALPSERHDVRVERTADSLLLTLRDAGGSKLAERRLGVGAPCADLASAAAVVIATWEVQLRGQGTLSLSLLQEPEPAVNAPPAPAPAMLIWLGVGAHGAGVSGSRSLAAEIELALRREAAAAEGALGLFFVGDHSVPLGSGAARWRRFGARIGGRVGIGGQRWQLAPAASAVLSLLAMAGEGFESDREVTAVDAGADAGVRLYWTHPGVRAWLGSNLFVWPIRRTLKLEGAPPTSDLPRWEVLIGAGLAFSIRR